MAIAMPILVKSYSVDYCTAVERAIQIHPEGCPAHQSVKDAIKVTWDATLNIDAEVIQLSSVAAAE
jgi:hypothetical protein